LRQPLKAMQRRSRHKAIGSLHRASAFVKARADNAMALCQMVPRRREVPVNPGGLAYLHLGHLPVDP